ncbi:hypothetical protein KL86PLE_10034 [uncultured Pleomorphomonas sp.]|uniref:Uncharacterized protein n=1 Tax=uncultured Pleomorphomonas sp. TaxID=442121 RepID=A0A212KXR2_9HYPH|nr:hypothetical protein KL86PLE_10034 [uncultured Pleomorphomonas sp.]
MLESIFHFLAQIFYEAIESGSS